MAKSTSISLVYRLSIFYRFVLSFALGYLCMMHLSLGLGSLFSHIFDKAEAIYLAAFISILFYLAFIIVSFCTHSLWKLSLTSLVLTGVLFGLSVGLN
ncbi:hypothetical protein F909_02410 [Acinetobacter sp. ANC 3929]|uniref:hypothetical protein n=1 Tax=unclassified Acinetobacter TaxID=196816 RepID=UPI0002D0DB3B|nr:MULTISPECIES: hypothetical protein [unclassified Acinetobacter]ENW81119.1 hypothetical protein F909_02410 [Acinetobacter sp. ANC 3929]MCH7351306.1 hypothetical protein [Acinetobacter sp. NIPH 2023]MCH7355639.1 hypothetical protein [Acinetobacter sp. NIPH 1958]MCH7358159.1 hypothetical protein [Acinetobacter sp. NIPH 2024]